MDRAFLIDDSSLVFRELDTIPSHRPPPERGNVSFSPLWSIIPVEARSPTAY